MQEIHYDVEKAIDYAFVEGKFVMDFLSYLKVKNCRRIDAQEFKKSITAKNIKQLAEELEIYLQGGQTEEAKYIREAYGHLSKPDARKIKNYLLGFINACDDFVKMKNARKSKRRPK